MTRAATPAPALSRRARAGLLVLALAGFLLAVYWQLPASLLLRFLPSPLPAPLSTSPGGLAANGSLWQGELLGLRAGAVPLSLRWELSPWRVLLGSLNGHATVASRKDQLSGDFQLDFQGHGELFNLQGNFGLEQLQPAATHPWRGQVVADRASVVIGPAGVTDFAGNVSVLALTSPALPQSLGDFSLEWARGADQGRVRNLRGPVTLHAAVLPMAGGGYRLEGEATTGADASPALRQALALIGVPDAAGRYRLAAEFGVSERP